jgi:hypothetical protein
MEKIVIKFENIKWEQTRVGLEEKIFSKGNSKLRLLRFSDNFIEERWCTDKHVGLVLDGEMKIDFDGRVEHFKKGDGVWISQGEDNKHKIMIEAGKKVELVLYEEQD